MKAINLSILILFLLVFTTLPGLTQDLEKSESADALTATIYLKGGTVFKGEIIWYNPDEGIKIKVEGDTELYFSKKYIKRIIHDSAADDVLKAHELKQYQFREKGIYHNTSFSTFASPTDRGDLFIGMGISHVSGYQFNRLAGLGFGIGIEGYDVSNRNSSVIPLFLEARGYLTKKKLSPYYNFQIGYGFPFVQMENTDLVNAKGGLLIYPAMGYRIGGSSSWNFVIDVGYKFQRITYEYENRWEKRKEMNTFRRIALRVGFNF